MVKTDGKGGVHTLWKETRSNLETRAGAKAIAVFQSGRPGAHLPFPLLMFEKQDEQKTRKALDVCAIGSNVCCVSTFNVANECDFYAKAPPLMLLCIPLLAQNLSQNLHLIPYCFLSKTS
jgi:hypothetical protein